MTDNYVSDEARRTIAEISQKHVETQFVSFASLNIEVYVHEMMPEDTDSMYIVGKVLEKFNDDITEKYVVIRETIYEMSYGRRWKACDCVKMNGCAKVVKLGQPEKKISA